MSATYVFVPLPLDAANADGPSFSVRILSTIQFSAGTTAGTDIAAVVLKHPLLSRDATPLRALSMPYTAWSTTRKIIAGAAGVKEVSLSYRGDHSLQSCRAFLADYLARRERTTVAQLCPDSAHDKRVPADFHDIARAHDRISKLRGILGQGFANRAGLRAASFDDLTDQSIGYAQRRWIDGQAQAGVVALLFGELKAQTLGLGPEGVQLQAQLRNDIAKQQKRLGATSGSPRRADRLSATAEGSDTDVDPRDPNVLIHAALTNGLVAEAAGIVSEWTATSIEPLVGDHVIALDPSNFPVDVVVTCKTTAFRRQESTHPLSFGDIGKPTKNGGLAALNDEKGAPRYSATGVNAEVAFVQATILQAANSMASAPSDGQSPLAAGDTRRDDRPPVELASQQFGFNELEAAGLTLPFSRGSMDRLPIGYGGGQAGKPS